MGTAIAQGLASQKQDLSLDIRISDINEPALQQIKTLFPAITTDSSNEAIIQGADIIILAVKPWLVEEIAASLRDKIDYNKQMLISIAAGVDLAELSQLFSTDATIFRVIPNTAIAVGESVSIISSYNADTSQEQVVHAIFSLLGMVFLVPEKQLNAYMSLSSCGIAYAFNYVRAAMRGGVEMGIAPEVAKRAVMQTIKGAIAVLENTNAHPDIEIDKVTTPGGITIKGLNEMEAQGFTNAVIKGLKASLIK